MTQVVRLVNCDLLEEATSDVLSGFGTTGRRGGSVMYLYVNLSVTEDGPAGEGTLKWLLAAPGTPIAPDFDESDVDDWRLQHYDSREYVALALKQVIQAFPFSRDWAMNTHRTLTDKLRARAAGRPAPKLDWLVDEFDSAQNLIDEEPRIAALKLHRRDVAARRILRTIEESHTSGRRVRAVSGCR